MPLQAGRPPTLPDGHGVRFRVLVSGVEAFCSERLQHITQLGGDDPRAPCSCSGLGSGGLHELLPRLHTLAPPASLPSVR